MKDLATVQTRIAEGVRAEGDIAFNRQELAETMQAATAEHWPSELTKREKWLEALYCLEISVMKFEHVREVAELERRLRLVSSMYFQLLADSRAS